MAVAVRMLRRLSGLRSLPAPAPRHRHRTCCCRHGNRLHRRRGWRRPRRRRRCRAWAEGGDRPPGPSSAKQPPSGRVSPPLAPRRRPPLVDLRPCLSSHPPPWVSLGCSLLAGLHPHRESTSIQPELMDHPIPPHTHTHHTPRSRSLVRSQVSAAAAIGSPGSRARRCQSRPRHSAGSSSTMWSGGSPGRPARLFCWRAILPVERIPQHPSQPTRPSRPPGHTRTQAQLAVRAFFCPTLLIACCLVPAWSGLVWLGLSCAAGSRARSSR